MSKELEIAKRELVDALTEPMIFAEDPVIPSTYIFSDKEAERIADAVDAVAFALIRHPRSPTPPAENPEPAADYDAIDALRMLIGNKLRPEAQRELARQILGEPSAAGPNVRLVVECGEDASATAKRVVPGLLRCQDKPELFWAAVASALNAFGLRRQEAGLSAGRTERGDSRSRGWQVMPESDAVAAWVLEVSFDGYGYEPSELFATAELAEAALKSFRGGGIASARVRRWVPDEATKERS